ncbi:MAG: hypothetical protein JOY69_08825 [Candidatus Eremiobacteraeota bacterium]|nr:hypothetical protein [Candidatus Eremiobacteraeota bacterium]
MTAYLAGIDGGQSSTTAVIGDACGRIVGRGRAGPADEINAGHESTRLHDALHGALQAARTAANLAGNTAFAAIVAGISGYEGRVYGKKPELPTQRLLLVHDALIAHAGALDGAAGVVAIAGTGSVVYATGGARPWLAGGWGYLFGDEGSAFWVARETLSALMQRADRGEDAGDEMRVAGEFFNAPTLRALGRAFYAGEISRERLAAFAPTAMRYPAGRAIAERGADALGATVRAALAAGATPTVTFVGGMFADARFREALARAIRSAFPATHFVAPKYEPSIGALALAYQEAGFGPFAEIRERT